MAKQIDEIVAIWNAITDNESHPPGWKVLPLTSDGSLRFLGGRLFPGSLESLLVQLPSRITISQHELPTARGFEVAITDPYQQGDKWISISRSKNGNADLFRTMIQDLLERLENQNKADPSKLASSLLIHIKMWQLFMSKAENHMGPERELGLFGELIVFEFLGEAVLAEDLLIGHWLGPENSPQDFVLSNGAIEVKTTSAGSPTLVKISSISQLDDSFISPIYMCFQRIKHSSTGRTLPELIEDITLKLKDPFSRELFNDKLLSAGYHSSNASRFNNRYSLTHREYYEIRDNFPRITSLQLTQAVSNVKYDLDLSYAYEFEVSESIVVRHLKGTE